MKEQPASEKAQRYELETGVNREFLEREYIQKGRGLRTLERELGISFFKLKFLVRFYGIQRSCADAIRLQNEKNKQLFLARYGVENPFQIPAVKESIVATKDHKGSYQAARATMQLRYGVDNPFQLASVKESIAKAAADPVLKAARYAKVKAAWVTMPAACIAARDRKSKATCLRRYGVDNPFKVPAFKAYIQTPAIKSRRRDAYERIGMWKSQAEKTAWELYRCEVRAFTRQSRKLLLAQHHTYCFYSGECLISNAEFQATHPGQHVTRNPLRPVVDHKISVIHGFKNNIPASVIGGLDNLCVCTQRANAQKSYRTEQEFYCSEKYENHTDKKIK